MMSDEADLTALTPLSDANALVVQADARHIVRRWSRPGGADAVEEAKLIGRHAIAHAAEVSRRLPTARASMLEMDAILNELRALTVPSPVQPAQWSPFKRVLSARDDVEARLGVLLGRLDAGHDALIRETIGLRGVHARLVEADAQLENVTQSMNTIIKQVEAAAREISSERPTDASMLRNEVLPIVEDRLREVLTQLVVTRQGILAINLLLDGHDRLTGTVASARHTLAAALRTALAASRALEDERVLREQAAALDQAAVAGGRHVVEGREVAMRRVLDDAVMRIGAAIAREPS